MTAAKITSPTIVLILSKEQAATAMGVGISTFEEQVRKKQLPPARQLSPARIGWLLEDLQEAARALPVADILPPRNSGYGRAGKSKQAA